ncbi:MAG TPA: ATP synthase subunit I [Terriglobia bacterium]|nr:ATP synthase subunit I [Terriglobia bacterium]
MPKTGKTAQQHGADWASAWTLDSTLACLPRSIAGVSAAAVLACLLAEQARFAAGLALGCGVALLGYWWLYRGIRAAFASGEARAPIGVFVRLALRYPVAIGAVLLFDRTGWLPARAVMAGLFAPLGGLVIEFMVLAVQSLRGRRAEAFTTKITEATEVH